MTRFLFIFILFTLTLISLSCETQDPNIDEETGTDHLKSLELDHKMNQNEMDYQDVFYVPIYSDIYVTSQNPKSLLAATLSIRNTSFLDSLFISTIDYFNTDGKLVKKFIEKPISLPPMATVNYIIEKEDDTGGPGANFIVSLSSKTGDSKPLIQAVMIGQNGGNQGFAFSTDGYSIKNKIKSD